MHSIYTYSCYKAMYYTVAVERLPSLLERMGGRNRECPRTSKREAENMFKQRDPPGFADHR